MWNDDRGVDEGQPKQDGEHEQQAAAAAEDGTVTPPAFDQTVTSTPDRDGNGNGGGIGPTTAAAGAFLDATTPKTATGNVGDRDVPWDSVCGVGAPSVTSSTRSVPGSLLGTTSNYTEQLRAYRYSGVTGGTSGTGGTGTGAVDIGGKLVEDLEGLEIVPRSSTRGEDDTDGGSVVSGVTTWAFLPPDGDDRSAKSGRSGGGSSRRGGRGSSRRSLSELEDVDEKVIATTGGGGTRKSGAGGGSGGQKVPRGQPSAAGRDQATAVASSSSAAASSPSKARQHHPHQTGAAAAAALSPSQSVEGGLEELPQTPTRAGRTSAGAAYSASSNAAPAGLFEQHPIPALENGGHTSSSGPSRGGVTAGAAGGAKAGAGSATEPVGDLLVGVLNDFRASIDRSLLDVRDQNRHDFERVLAVMQNESAKRTSLEQRLHAQLLLQSETMVAMEMKLLRLEARVEKNQGDASAGAQRQSRGSHRSSGSGQPLLPSTVLGSSTAPVPAPGGVIVPASALNVSTTLPPISSNTPSPGTIDEEDDLGSLEVPRDVQQIPRAVRASVTRSGGGGGGRARDRGSDGDRPGPNIAVVSSGASLASAVTDGFIDGESTHFDDASTKEDDNSSDEERGGGDDDDDEGGDTVDGSASTPTFSSRAHTLDSILMDPMIRGEVSTHGASTRATRGDEDGSSTLATSVTSTTLGSTVVTATTRGESVGNIRALSGLSEGGVVEYGGGGSGDDSGGIVDANPASFALSPPAEERSQRSRSQSPLTVQSRETAMSVGPSIASIPSIAASQWSTAVVAPARSYRGRTRVGGGSINSETRPLANRVVQFTSGVPPEITEDGDNVTIPDELDNMSDVADAFARNATQWREEYEARLDAIQKRWGGD